MRLIDAVDTDREVGITGIEYGVKTRSGIWRLQQSSHGSEQRLLRLAFWAPQSVHGGVVHCPEKGPQKPWT